MSKYNTTSYGRTQKYGKGVELAVFTKFSGNCSICNNKEYLQIFHVKSVMEGGDHSLGNLVLLCRVCGMKEVNRKKTLIPDLWAQRAYMKRWRKLHPGYMRFKRREFNARNKGYATARAKAYYEKHVSIRKEYETH